MNRKIVPVRKFKKIDHDRIYFNKNSSKCKCIAHRYRRYQIKQTHNIHRHSKKIQALVGWGVPRDVLITSFRNLNFWHNFFSNRKGIKKQKNLAGGTFLNRHIPNGTFRGPKLS